MKVNNILETIGNTPHVRLNNLFKNNEVWMKLERANPGGSIKDRIALAMINDAEEKGLLNKDSIIVEPTSGNTGIGLAMVAAVKGYKIILCMPESMSIERRKIMAAFGAQFELTPREKGMKGAIARAQELVQEHKNAWMPMQFDNEANTKIHMTTTAQEILRDFPEGLDYVITGVGTGGHITGVGKILKEKMPGIKIIAVEPVLSPVLSGGQHSPHPIQGIGAGFIPNIMDTSVLDEIIKISKEEAFEFAKRASAEEGIFIGISSGGALAAVNQKIDSIEKGKRILTFCYDTGERYLSVEGLFQPAES